MHVRDGSNHQPTTDAPDNLGSQLKLKDDISRQIGDLLARIPTASLEQLQLIDATLTNLLADPESKLSSEAPANEQQGDSHHITSTALPCNDEELTAFECVRAYVPNSDRRDSESWALELTGDETILKMVGVAINSNNVMQIVVAPANSNEETFLYCRLLGTYDGRPIEVEVNNGMGTYPLGEPLPAPFEITEFWMDDLRLEPAGIDQLERAQGQLTVAIRSFDKRITDALENMAYHHAREGSDLGSNFIASFEQAHAALASESTQSTSETPAQTMVDPVRDRLLTELRKDYDRLGNAVAILASLADSATGDEVTAYTGLHADIESCLRCTQKLALLRLEEYIADTLREKDSSVLRVAAEAITGKRFWGGPCFR